nr:DUF4192 domain-containing protein [Actinomadura madurae]
MSSHDTPGDPLRTGRHRGRPLPARLPPVPQPRRDRLRGPLRRHVRDPARLTVRRRRRVAALLAANGFTRSLVLGYGPAGEVAAAAAPMRAALSDAGVPAAEAIRVAEGRWWSLTCDDDCCPPEGTPYDISASALAAQATFAGHVALADRAELVASVAPIGGPAMHRATERAEKRRLACPRVDAESDLAFVLALLAHVRTGIRPTDDEVAWLGLLLTDLRIRDEAWIRIDEDAPAADIAFWRDIVRRVDERHVPAPASLLAFAAYTAGDGGLANVALQRALDADPAYSMAVLLREVIHAGIPRPSSAWA